MTPHTYALWVDVTPENEDILVPVLSAQLPKDVAHRVGQEGYLLVGEPIVEVTTVVLLDEDGLPHEMRRVTCRAKYLTVDLMPKSIRENWNAND